MPLKRASLRQRHDHVGRDDEGTTECVQPLRPSKDKAGARPRLALRSANEQGARLLLGQARARPKHIWR